MGFSNDFSPFNSPQRSFGKELDKLREPLTEMGKKSASMAGEAAAGSAAAEICKALVLRIVQFDGQLPAEEEVGVRLFGPGGPFDLSLDDVDSLAANLIVLSGRALDGASVEAVQNVSQLNVVLISLARRFPDEPKSQKRFHTRYADLFEKLAAKEEAPPSTAEGPAPPPAETT